MKKPNVLIVMTDQQSSWSISALGARDISTPYIDRVGNEGAIFEQFFTPCAVCTPSRGSLLTGLHTPQHGAHKNQLPLSFEAKTIAEVFKENGYSTGYAGKWHLNGEDKPGFMTEKDSHGFTDCRYMFNRGHWKKLIEDQETGEVSVADYNDSYAGAMGDEIGDETTYTTDFLCDKAVEFIKDRDKATPFLYMISIPDPHTPFSVREPYDTMFDPAKINLPEAFYKSCPPWMPEGFNRGKSCPDRKVASELLAAYLGEVKCIDDNMGKLFKTLEQEEILDNTIIVFTTDHGEYMGEHGLWGKNSSFSSVFHIPFLIRYPEKINSGTKVDNYVSMLDFKKMLTSLANVADDSEDMGRDATVLLNGKCTDWQDSVHMYTSDFDSIMMQKNDIFLSLREDGHHMLFDMKNDVNQYNNLYSLDEYKPLVNELTTEIIDMHKKIESPALSWLF